MQLLGDEGPKESGRPAAAPGPASSAAATSGLGRLLVLAALPLVLLAGVLFLAATVGVPVGAALPSEDLAFERVVVRDDGFTLHARNAGRDDIEVGQVLVNDMLVGFEARPAGPVERLDTVTFDVPYHWVEGEPYEIKFVTAGGFVFGAEVAAAVATPVADARTLGTLAMLGVYVGVVPVLAGLLWRPVLERAGVRVVRVALGFTLGLLAFLALDTFVEGLEIAEEATAAFDPVIVLVGGALAAFALLLAVGDRLRTRRRAGAGPTVSGPDPLALATLVAIGVGLHNLAEGLAIGGAFALGEAALGLALVVGFAIHNTTEGLAIVAPMSGRPVRLAALAALGLVAGAPTILGAWLGGLAASPLAALAMLSVGVGAIAAVVVEIDRAWAGELRRGGALAGAAVGFAFMYVTGLMVVV